MTKPFIDNSKSSACCITKQSKSYADFIILDINLVFCIVFTPSVNPTIPFPLSKPNSVILVPSRFFVSVAVGRIFIFDLSRPRLFKKSTIDTLSITGDVFGIVTTEVTPPASAALLNVLKFSLYSNPGSPTKTRISTIPGNIYFSFKSINFSLDGILFLLTFLPIASIFPFSLTIKPPSSSNELRGSTIFAFKKYFFFIIHKIFLSKPFLQLLLTQLVLLLHFY